MSTVPTKPTNSEQINDRPSRIVADAMLALAAHHPQTAEQAEDLLRFWVRRPEMTDADVADVCGRLFPRPGDCPDWCTFDHSTDDARDDLVLHQAGDHADDGIRGVLGEQARLSIRVARTDCPPEGRKGTPSLVVISELELTTWEQAAELARLILDSFGHLKGADE